MVCFEEAGKMKEWEIKGKEAEGEPTLPELPQNAHSWGGEKQQLDIDCLEAVFMVARGIFSNWYTIGVC